MGVAALVRRHPESREWIEAVREGRVPEGPPVRPKTYALSWELIAHQRGYGMWANVDLSWTKHAAEWIGERRALEVMSGRGWLASALRHHGVDLIATDDYSWGTGGERLTEVVKRNATRAVREFGGEADVLIAAWPPYNSRAMDVAIRAWGREKPVLFVGEIWGATGSKHLTTVVMKGWACQVRWGYSAWPNFHDDVFTGVPYEGEHLGL